MLPYYILYYFKFYALHLYYKVVILQKKILKFAIPVPNL